MARLVPGSDEGCGGACSTNTSPLAEEEEGGCGSANGRTVGGDMAGVEKQLAQNETAIEQNLEVEITVKNVKQGKSKKKSAPPQQKKGNKQVMGQCRICGYLSSQDVCKACVLLEGLNKARPKNGIEVGYEGGGKGVDRVVGALGRTIIGGD